MYLRSPETLGEQSIAAQAAAEIEFGLGTTLEAEWATTYYVRLSDAGAPVDGASVAQVRLGPAPPVVLSAPQFAGIPADRQPPLTASLARAAASPAQAPPSLPGEMVATSVSTSAMGFAAAPLLAAATNTSPHGAGAPTVDACAACHKTHTSPGQPVLSRPAPQSTLCLACHDGTGANSNVAAEYADPSVPANDPTTSSFYSHPATANYPYSSPLVDTFKGVLNRRSDCTDCHNPHAASATGSATMTATGWTPSGSLNGSTGVAVTNGEPYTPALARRELDKRLPFIKREGLALLTTSYPSTEAAQHAIGEHPFYYQQTYPTLYSEQPGAVAAATRALQDVYPRVARPEMDASYKDYPSFLGHTDGAGCFRCHDGKHVKLDPAGKPTSVIIPSQCSTCHTPPQMGSDNSSPESLVGVPSASHKTRMRTDHAAVIREEGGTGRCVLCHQSTSCSSCHAADVLHERPIVAPR